MLLFKYAFLRLQIQPKMCIVVLDKHDAIGVFSEVLAALSLLQKKNVLLYFITLSLSQM